MNPTNVNIKNKKKKQKTEFVRCQNDKKKQSNKSNEMKSNQIT